MMLYSSYANFEVLLQIWLKRERKTERTKFDDPVTSSNNLLLSQSMFVFVNTIKFAILFTFGNVLAVGRWVETNIT